MKKTNRLLVFGGTLSTAAALLHVVIVIGGPRWYLFWCRRRASGAGLIRQLPLLKVGLVAISAIYLLRGIAFIPAYIVKPEIVDEFLVWSSFISLVYGFAYTMGTKQVWARLSAN